MEDITIIYKNDKGLAFIWKRTSVKNHGKIHLVFNNTALHFSKEELLHFSKLTEIALVSPLNYKNCCGDSCCKSMLLETPIPQLSFAMSFEELKAIDDLIKGTLFELGLDLLLRKIL